MRFSSRASAACAETGNIAPAVIDTLSLGGSPQRHPVKTAAKFLTPCEV